MRSVTVLLLVSATVLTTPVASAGEGGRRCGAVRPPSARFDNTSDKGTLRLVFKLAGCKREMGGGFFVEWSGQRESFPARVEAGGMHACLGTGIKTCRTKMVLPDYDRRIDADASHFRFEVKYTRHRGPKKATYVFEATCLRSAVSSVDTCYTH